MGLFDIFSNIKTPQATNLIPAEAFTGILLVVIAADGCVGQEESKSLMSTLYKMKLFQSYANDHVSRMIAKTAKIARTTNSDTLLNLAVQCLPEHLHETAFAVATDLTLSDGEVSEAEEYILQKICNRLSISKDKVNKIIEVMMIKNRG